MHKIILGDCRDVLAKIEECSIDLIVTDPPYKITKTSGSATSSSLGHKWTGNIKACDKNAGIVNDTSFGEWMTLAHRVLRDGAHCYVFTNDKNMTDLLKIAEVSGFRLSNILVWKKQNCTPNRYYMKNCEFIVFLYKGRAKTINDYSSSQFMEYSNVNGKDKLHPTEKPIPLLEKLITNSSEEGQIVLDPFAGSGTTLRAAENTRRNSIGIEVDLQYVNISKQRFIEPSEYQLAIDL